MSPRSGSCVPASHGNPRPGAVCCSAPFCAAYGLVATTGPSSIGVEFGVAGVNHQPLEVRFINDGIEKVFPHSAISPAAEATMGVFPVSQVWWQVPPEPAPYLIRGCPSAQVPKHRVQEQPLVPGGPSFFPWTTRQVGLKKFPNLIRNVVASMPCRHISTPHLPFHNSNVPSCYCFDDTP